MHNDDAREVVKPGETRGLKAALFAGRNSPLAQLLGALAGASCQRI